MQHQTGGRLLPARYQPVMERTRLYEPLATAVLLVLLSPGWRPPSHHMTAGGRTTSREFSIGFLDSGGHGNSRVYFS